MNSKLLSLLLLLSVSNLFASQNRKVLIIGIDGTRSDAFQQANTPNMDALLANSLYSFDSWHTGITWSGPSWTTILTGAQWNKHLVINNSFTNHDFVNYPPFPTRAKEIYPYLNCSIVAEWYPLIDNITNAGWNHTVKVPDGGNWQTVDSAVAELQNPDLDLLFAYFDKVDLTGHATTFSPLNPLYISAIQDVDSAVGKILNALYARPTYSNENWLILLITDHGGKNFLHGGNSTEERYIWWVASGSAVAHQQINQADPGTYNCGLNNVFDTTCVNTTLMKQSPTHPDIAVTALHHLIYDSGINPETKPEWNLDGKSWLLNLNGVNEIFSEENIIVYPNPASNQLIVRGCLLSVEKQIAIELYSMDGKKVWSKIPSAKDISINTGNFSKGIYILKSGSVSKKVVIE